MAEERDVSNAAEDPGPAAAEEGTAKTKDDAAKGDAAKGDAANDAAAKGDAAKGDTAKDDPAKDGDEPPRGR